MPENCLSACAVTDLLPPTKALSQGFACDTVRATDYGSPDDLAANSQARQGFRIGSMSVMIHYDEASELTELPHVHRLPNSPDWFVGMVNLKGRPVPVLDMSRYLGNEGIRESQRMLLVLSRDINATGILIDGIPERLKLSAGDQVDTATAPHRLAPNLRGAYVIDGRLWFDLECDRMLDALEHALAEYQ